jgi:hypothetical protein
MSEFWDDNEFPLAYLFTLQTFGTWLHGDDRGSVDRHGKNIYGTERIVPNVKFQAQMSRSIDQLPFLSIKHKDKL